MELKNKYNINDRVFILEHGHVIHARITKIDAEITEDKTELYYYLTGDSSYAQDYIENAYEEDQLSTTIEELINKLEVL